MKQAIKKAGLFIGLTYSFSWLLASLFVFLGGEWNTPIATVIAVLYMFVPMTIAIVIQRLIYKEPIREPLEISFRLNHWFLIAWLLPPVIAFATLGVSLLFPGVTYSPEMEGMLERFRFVLSPEQAQEMKRQFENSLIHPIWLGLLQGLLAGITINAVAGFGEELGWRGFLQRELTYLGFWKSSGAIGLIWGVWHAPLILQGHNYPQHPVAGVFMMIVWTTLLAPIFSLVRLKAQSVIAAAILHGSVNATIGLALMVIKGGNDLTIGVTGLAGFIVLAVVNLGIFLYQRICAQDLPFIAPTANPASPEQDSHQLCTPERKGES